MQGPVRVPMILGNEEALNGATASCLLDVGRRPDAKTSQCLLIAPDLAGLTNPFFVFRPSN